VVRAIVSQNGTQEAYFGNISAYGIKKYFRAFCWLFLQAILILPIPLM
jgi:hypothetical protein